MNDICFPPWVTASPVFAMASLLSRSLQQAYLPAAAVAPANSTGSRNSSNSCDNGGENDDCATSSSSDSERRVPCPQTMDAAVPEILPPVGNTQSILHDDRVARLFRLSKMNEICSGEESNVSAKHAVALVSLMAFAVECRMLPSEVTKGFYTECSSLYSTLMSHLPSLAYHEGVDIEGMVASLVACGLKLRQCDKEAGDRPTSYSTHRSTNTSLSGFDSRIVDNIIVACVPEDIDRCANDTFALGALQGLALTVSHQPVFLEPVLINRLHDLTDAFARSSHRRDLPYKYLFSLLLEALSRSGAIDYPRINNWVTAIIQESYVVRGLFQCEILHARVVAAILTLLVRQYQELANEYVKSCGGVGGMPDFTEGDHLIELLWKALQEAVVSHEESSTPNKRLTLFGANLRVVLENLLRTEVERLRCYHIITSASIATQQQILSRSQSFTVASRSHQWPGLNIQARSGGDSKAGAKESPDSEEEGSERVDAADARTLYFPSSDEELLRVRIMRNITKYLLLPGSMVQGVLRQQEGTELRAYVLGHCSTVLTLVAATEFTTNPTTTARGSSPSSKASWKQQARFSNGYYQRVESMALELVKIVMEDGDGYCCEAGDVAALCLQSICTGDAHIRSFTVSEVMDTVVRIFSASGDAPTSNADINPHRLSLCFSMLCDIIVPQHYSVVRTLPYVQLARYGQMLCDIYEDSLRQQLECSLTEKCSSTEMLAKIPTPRMRVASGAYWQLVVRVHERLRVVTYDLANLPERSQERQLYWKLLQWEEKGIHVLIQRTVQCALNIAWPGSGILTRTPPVNDILNEDAMAALAVTAISPLFKPLGLLFQLSTIYPLRSLRQLLTHSENARYLTLDGYREQHILHYYYRPTQMTGVDLANRSAKEKAAVGDAMSASHLAQFRSFWLMLTYYGFSSEAVSLSRRNIDSSTAPTWIYSGRSHLNDEQTLNIRLLAASAPPFMQMRSSDMHQAMADIEVLFRSLDGGSCPTSTRSDLHSHLVDTMRQLCGGERHWRQLSGGELFLMRSLTDLELLRASSGSIANLTLYHHYEVREFVATPAIKHVMRHITDCVCQQYISALRAYLRPTAYKLLRKDIHQLVLLLGFSIASVRESARSILTMVLETYPDIAAYSDGLPLLWEIINLVQAGTAAEIESFCRHARFNDTPAVSTDASSTDRRVQLQALCEVAEAWAAMAQSSAPAVLFHSAVKFVVLQAMKGSRGTVCPLVGSQLATMAAQPLIGKLPRSAMKGVRAVGELCLPNWSETLVRCSSAHRQWLSAIRVTPFERVQQNILRQLKEAVGQNNRANAPTANCRSAESRRVEIESLLCSAASTLTTGFTTTATSELLRYFVVGPIRTMDSTCIAAGLGCWRSLLTHESGRFVLPLLHNICEGIGWSVERGVGLFDGARPSCMAAVQTGVSNGKTISAYEFNSPHRLLFGFLANNYVDPDAPWSMDPSVLLPLYSLCTRMVEHMDRFSLKDFSFAETIHWAVLTGHVCRHLHSTNTRQQKNGMMVVVPYTSVGVLRQRWYACLLQWFRKTPPSWYFARDPTRAQEEVAALDSLIQLLKDEHTLVGHTPRGFMDFSVDVPHTKERPASSGPAPQLANIWGISSRLRGPLKALRYGDDKAEETLTKLIAGEQQRLQELINLLRMLVSHELVRLKVWQTPRRTLLIKDTYDNIDRWEVMVRCAAQHDPAVLVAMVRRFDCVPLVHELASQQVMDDPERFAHIPEAADLYVSEETLATEVPKLMIFAPCSIVQALRFLHQQYTKYPEVAAYAIRSVLAQDSEHLIFYLPQLLQVLATDLTGSIQASLERMSSSSTVFCHQLLWSLETEGQSETKLAKRCQQLSEQIHADFNAVQQEFYVNEFAFTNLVTSLSGELMQVGKAERKSKLRIRLRDAIFHDSILQQHLYLPTDPSFRIVDVIPHTAGAMQSAAKCPILVQFQCVPREHEAVEIELPQTALTPVVKACIFKMGDDCRQDQLSLQLIGLMKRVLEEVGVPFFLYPYRVVTTGQDSGIIECIPRSLSRNEIGKLVELNLAEYFVQTFGHPESVRFRKARDNFVKSVASYSVVSYILNIKDRHNGNIMITDEGYLVHIDFGFLFDTSPGGDMNFESSPFKLTTEMVQLIGMDVGSNLRSPSLTKALVLEESYVYFKTLVNRCYLAVRQHAREICILVELMLRSGLPCFKPRQTIAHLAKRLAVGKTEVEAADFMRRLIHQSRQNLRTVLYDQYQRIAEGIQM